MHRVRELLEQLDHAGVDGEVILVLDGGLRNGSETKTEGLHDSSRVHILQLRESCGKAAAMSAGAALSTSDILAFADVRQVWEDDALLSLLKRFRDQRVGAVSGELILKTDNGGNSGVGTYWRFEKWLRYHESLLDSTVGVTGAICAVRRNLFHGVPEGTILDDVYWPLRVVQQGYRVVHERQALAYDALPVSARDEFRRKVRTLTGNYQLLGLLPSALLPWKNRIWWQFISHKLMRLLVPWLLILAVFSCYMSEPLPYRVLLYLQLGLYASLAVSLMTGITLGNRFLAAANSFAMLNAAAFVAFWVWVTGNSGRTWHPSSSGQSASPRANAPLTSLDPGDNTTHP